MNKQDLVSTPVNIVEVELMEGIDLKNIPLPFIMKNKTVMSPGYWKGFYYSKDEVIKSFTMNDWSNQRMRALINEHIPHAQEWVGEISNPQLDSDNGNIYADLVIVDESAARKLAYGAKFGISPRIVGNSIGNAVTDLVYENWSVVWDPAVKTTFLNSENIPNEVNNMGTGDEVPSPSVVPTLAATPVVVDNGITQLSASLSEMTSSIRSGFVELGAKLDSVCKKMESAPVQVNNSNVAVEVPKVEQELHEDTIPVRTTTPGGSVEKTLSSQELTNELNGMETEEKNKLFIAHLHARKNNSTIDLKRVM